MRKLEKRSVICLTLAAILLAGMVYFVICYAHDGADWASFYGNQSVYENGVLKDGEIYDINGAALFSASNGEGLYNSDEEIRTATVHAVGDLQGNISTSALQSYTDKIIGYNPVTGTYKAIEGDEKIVLTIDSEVCRVAYEGLQGYKSGCVGVFNYETGDIICMVSTPAFDPENPPEVSEDDDSGIYINRFISSTFTPGSIFKTVTSAAVIETMDNYEDFSYYCTGSRDVNGTPINCYGVHGEVDFTQAFASSCNGAFSLLADEVGADTMERYVKKLGLTSSYDIDGVKTAAGSFSFPSDSDADLGWAGAGQFEDLVNPCSMMVYIGAIANGGRAVTPHLVYEEGREIESKQIIKRSTAEYLQSMMKSAVINTYGEYRFPGLDIYAKTGSAEVGDHTNGTFVGFIKNEGYPYAFFVFVEDCYGGLQSATPIANDVLQAIVGQGD
ncbi:MAG: penicillin-binding transpeptidase domain-containing protein [Eubacterium sp.]|jgi:peptidoglycan glycosyltransferase